MPIYEYECKQCNTVFETIVSSNSQEDIQCEQCGGKEVNKLISAAGIKVSKGTPLPSPSSCNPRGGFS